MILFRAGRTARYNTAGESLLVLLPQEEEGMLKQLNAHKIPISKIEVKYMPIYLSYFLSCRKNKERTS